MHRLFILFLCFCFLNGCNLTKQISLKQDLRTEQLIRTGKRYLGNGDYKSAWDSFELARERSFNQSTTTAIYFCGLASYYLEYNDVALQRFNELINDYPKSRYLENAKYHKALMQINHAQGARNKEAGLIELSRLLASRDSRLASDAKATLQKQLFEVVSLNFLKRFFGNAPESIEQMVMEALLYKELEAGNREEAQNRYNLYLENNGKDNAFFQKLFPEKIENLPKPIFEPEILRIALFLPIYANSDNFGYGSKIPDRSVRGLEFYEGMEMALNELGEDSRKKIYLRVFDTYRDTTATKSQLQELDQLRPQIIIGAIYNATSRIISAYAEEKGIPQIVPMSPAEDLVEEKNFTFLAHPAVRTHGARMADYAFDVLKLNFVSIFSDKSNGTAELAEGFMERFSLLGGTVDTLFFGTDFKEEALEEIPEHIDQVEDSTGVYIPLMGNEEAASLIVNLLKKEEKSVHVMGSPHFRSRYTTLPIDVKEDFKILFSTSHLDSQYDLNYKKVYTEYLKNYKMPPSDNSIQGYDLAKFIINMLDTYDPALGVGLETFLRTAPSYKGLHIDYYFGSTQSNQSVNIGQYTAEGVVKVK